MKKFSYGELILQVLGTILSYRFIWVIGLLAALSSGEIACLKTGPAWQLREGGSRYIFVEANITDFYRLISSLNAYDGQFTAFIVSVLFWGGCLWLIGLLGHASLVTATIAIDQEQDATLSQSLQNGLRFVLPMVGISFVLYTPYGVISYFLARDFLTSSLLWSVFGLFLLSIVIGTIYSLARCALVFHNLDVLSSIANGVSFLLRHLGKLIIVVLALVLVMLVYNSILLAVLNSFMGDSLTAALFSWLATKTIGMREVVPIAGSSLLLVILNVPVVLCKSIAITVAYLHLSSLDQNRRKSIW